MKSNSLRFEYALSNKSILFTITDEKRLRQAANKNDYSLGNDKQKYKGKHLKH